jgi:hypothetical protein
LVIHSKQVSHFVEITNGDVIAHLYQNYLEKPPNPRETRERMNFNDIDKKNN